MSLDFEPGVSIFFESGTKYLRGKESMSLEQRKAETEKQRKEGDWETEKQGKTEDAAELPFLWGN